MGDAGVVATHICPLGRDQTWSALTIRRVHEVLTSCDLRILSVLQVSAAETYCEKDPEMIPVLLFQGRIGIKHTRLQAPVHDTILIPSIANNITTSGVSCFQSRAAVKHSTQPGRTDGRGLIKRAEHLSSDYCYYLCSHQSDPAQLLPRLPWA